MRTYVERDVRRVAAVDDAGLFARFVGLCAAHSAQEINHSQLGRELGISYHTAQRWLAILRATFQWLEVPPFSNSPAKRVSRRSKGYFADTGFAAWTQRISSPAALMSNPVQGALFETHVVLDILRQTQAMRYPPRLHHWRQHSGAEVDLVLERDGVLVAVEAKSKARVSRGDTRGIRAFRENHPEQSHGIGIVVAAVTAPMLLGDDIVALPYDIACVHVAPAGGRVWRFADTTAIGRWVRRTGAVTRNFASSVRATRWHHRGPRAGLDAAAGQSISTGGTPLSLQRVRRWAGAFHAVGGAVHEALTRTLRRFLVSGGERATAASAGSSARREPWRSTPSSASMRRGESPPTTTSRPGTR